MNFQSDQLGQYVCCKELTFGDCEFIIIVGKKNSRAQAGFDKWVQNWNCAWLHKMMDHKILCKIIGKLSKLACFITQKIFLVFMKRSSLNMRVKCAEKWLERKPKMLASLVR